MRTTIYMVILLSLFFTAFAWCEKTHFAETD